MDIQKQIETVKSIVAAYYINNATYCKINGLSHDEQMAKKWERLNKPMNIQSKGLGLESKFGLGKSKGLASKPSAAVRQSTSISEQDNGLDKT